MIASDGYMTFVGYLYDKLSWTTGSLNGGNQSGLGGHKAKVEKLVFPKLQLWVANKSIKI